MSASASAKPDPFDWELLKTSSSSSSSAAPPPSADSSRGGLGESGGVVSKRLPLWSVGPVFSACVCAGYVGKGGKRFCILPVSDVGGSCATQSHATSKFKLIGDSFYTRVNDRVAFCYPSYPHALISSLEQRETILAEAKTQVEWRSFFTNMNTLDREIERDIFEGIPIKPSVSVKLDFNPTLGLKTPAKRLIDGRVDRIWEAELTPFIEAPQLPVKSSENNSTFWARAASDWSDSVPSDLILVLKQIHDAFVSLTETWPEPFRDIEKQFSLIGGDLEQVQEAIERMRTEVGRATPIQDIDMPDIWCALDFLSTSVSDLQASMGTPSGLNDLMLHVKDLQDKQIALGLLVREVKATCVEYDNRFSMIGPVLMECRKFISATPVATATQSYRSVEDLDQRLRLMEMRTQPQKIDELVDRLTKLELQSRPSVWPLDTACSTTDIGLLKDTIAKLNSKVESLERRVVGDGLSLGMYIFQSFDDLCVWMRLHVKNNRYGLFVDAIGLFELFCTEHIDTATALGSFNNSQKTGFASMYEATLAASMQNVLPSLLGKGSTDGMDTSRFLPGLKSSDQWSHNGVTGLRFQIERELPNVDSQLGSEIATAFSDSPEAAGLARECLFTSKRFISQLCQFITNDFEFWSGRGYSKTDAWSLVCQSLRRIFDEIHSERVYGRHVKSTNVETTAAKYVWAVLKAHQVMEQFSKHNFDGHPSISAVVARHLASNHFKPTDDAKTLSAQVKKCESSVTALSKQFDSLESRVNRNLGKLNNGGDGGGGGGGRGGKGRKADET